MNRDCCVVLPYQFVASMYYATTKDPKPFLTFNDICRFCDILSSKMPECLIEDNGLMWTPKFYGMPIRITYEQKLKNYAYKDMASSILIDHYGLDEADERYVSALTNLNRQNPVDEKTLEKVCRVVFGGAGWTKYNNMRNTYVVYKKDKYFERNPETAARILSLLLDRNSYKSNSNFYCAIWGISGREFDFDNTKENQIMRCIESASAELDKSGNANSGDALMIADFVNKLQSDNSQMY